MEKYEHDCWGITCRIYGSKPSHKPMFTIVIWTLRAKRQLVSNQTIKLLIKGNGYANVVRKKVAVLFPSQRVKYHYL